MWQASRYEPHRRISPTSMRRRPWSKSTSWKPTPCNRRYLQPPWRTWQQWRQCTRPKGCTINSAGFCRLGFATLRLEMRPQCELINRSLTALGLWKSHNPFGLQTWLGLLCQKHPEPHISLSYHHSWQTDPLRRPCHISRHRRYVSLNLGHHASSWSHLFEVQTWDSLGILEMISEEVAMWKSWGVVRIPWLVVGWYHWKVNHIVKSSAEGFCTSNHLPFSNRTGCSWSCGWWFCIGGGCSGLSGRWSGSGSDCKSEPRGLVHWSYNHSGITLGSD